MAVIETPCTKICTVDPVSQLCLGCGRNLGEIARWTDYTDAERAAIMTKLPARLATFANRSKIRRDLRDIVVGSRLIWVLWIGLVGALLLLLAHQGGTRIAGLSASDFASLINIVGILVLVSGSALLLFRGNFSKALQAALFWVVFGLVLAVGYTYRMELRDTADRVLAEFIPGRAYSKGRVVEIARGRAGDFQVSASVNGVRIPMALDTGASAVVLTYDAAKAAGLPLEVLTYNVNVDTANGRTHAASVTLDRLGVGGVIERAVPALIAQPGQLKTNLLGMTFLNRLESWEVRGDRLILRGYP